MKKVIITQSNYIPWKGYFDGIKTVDEVVLYDDMQFTKRDWRNRNMIKTASGPIWLTIPVEVKGKFFQKINETKISDIRWNEKHWKSIQLSYSKAPFYKEHAEFIADLYSKATMSFLSEVNYWFLTELSKWMGIKTVFRTSSEFTLEEERNERLISICQQLKATHYYSGPAAKNYMDEDLFRKAGIDVHYFDYTGYPEYPQLYPPFTHAVSIIDLIFNTGTNCKQYMKAFQ